MQFLGWNILCPPIAEFHFLGRSAIRLSKRHLPGQVQILFRLLSNRFLYGQAKEKVGYKAFAWQIVSEFFLF